jgi:hypothetical protein
MITLTDPLAGTTPSDDENENKLVLSTRNWNEVAKSLLFTTLTSLLVVLPNDTSPKFILLALKCTSYPIPIPKQLMLIKFPPLL